MPAPLPPDRARLETLRLYLQLQLDEVDRALAALREPRQPYAIEHVPNPSGTGAGRGVLHLAVCRNMQDLAPGRRLIEAGEAMALQAYLDKGGPTAACPECKPQRRLEAVAGKGAERRRA
ncbi:hypothetical protein AB0M28_13370 [Streptomyces sp. NPDC051940]|uniref:hypothetical protein n=1 Tax=Streptomyces sp. NPDC051940 TaxID=3155675 RepID=UPI00341F3E01